MNPLEKDRQPQGSSWVKMKRSVKSLTLFPLALYLDALNLPLSHSTHHRGEESVEQWCVLLDGREMQQKWRWEMETDVHGQTYRKKSKRVCQMYGQDESNTYRENMSCMMLKNLLCSMCKLPMATLQGKVVKFHNTAMNNLFYYTDICWECTQHEYDYI